MSYLINLFLLDSDPSLLLFGTYNPWLVVLSLVVATFTSGMALQLAGVARISRSPLYRELALATGAVALGGGVWAMHFIGMLSLQLCATVRYDPVITCVSVLPSLAASRVALGLLARRVVSPLQLIVGGVLVGGGIGTMHYSGMAAMQMAPLLRYDPWMFALSILVAVLLAIIALWVRFGLRGRMSSLAAIVIGGVVMGLAISGMHYTGMAAARFVGAQEFAEPRGVDGGFYLALAVAMATLTLSVAAGAVNGLLRYRQLFTQLEAGKRHLNSLLDAAFEAIFTVDHQGIIRSVSWAVEGLYGWRPDELVGRHMSVLMTEEQSHAFGDALQRYVASGTSQLSGSELELTGVAKDGRLIPVRLSIGISEYEGRPWFVVFVADISQRKQMEQALRDSEQQYRSLIRNIPGVSFRCLLDAEWTMLFISDAVEPLTGWPAEDFISRRKSFAELYHPDDVQRVAEEVGLAIAEGRNYVIEYRLFDRQGREHWIWESGSAVLDEQGVPRWIDGVLLDQTETKQRNAEYEGKVTAISKAMAMIEFDLQGNVLAANENFLDLFGYGLDEVLGQHHALFCDPAHVQSEAYSCFWSDLRRGNFRQGEYRRLAKDGREVWIQATYNPILNLDGKPFKVVKLATDLTPRRLMEQELRTARDRAEQAAAARSSFLANMSHEIRTPMNAIIGFTELLLDTSLEETQRRHLRTVQQASRSLLGLLNDILDTAKLDRGAIELESLDFSLRELCEQVCDTQRLTAERKGLELRLDYAEALGDYFKGDPLRLQQVLSNLLGNAVKFTERGEVRLQVSGTPGALRLIVHDTGIGIAADRLERIFDPFAQADASMSRRFGGTGLGTTISRQLVELMGGRIRVESELGVGSRFIVELPLSAGQGIERPRERRQAPRLPPLRILAADDVAQNLELLVLNLERLGHQVATVADGEAAVERFTREPFDLVLMDVQMPGTDGLEASRRIRAWEQREQRVPVPIIALTASVLDRDRQDALDAGMNGFASKPLEMSALVAEMAGVLGLAATVQAAPTSSDGAQGLFDWVRGARLWGGPLPMAAAIARFLEEQADLEPLRAALQQEDFNGLEQLAHRLRGVAGNLGLVKLSKAAFNLEQAAHAGAAARCSELIEVWAEAFAAVRTTLPLQPEAAAMPVASVDTAQLLLALQSLSAELERGGLDEAALRLLEQGLPEAQNEMRAVRQAVDDFEFEQALEHLRAVRQLLSRETAE
jgi:PAS domain S-box-containing protein